MTAALGLAALAVVAYAFEAVVSSFPVEGGNPLRGLASSMLLLARATLALVGVLLATLAVAPLLRLLAGALRSKPPGRQLVKAAEERKKRKRG